MSGSDNTFFIRYIIVENTLTPCKPSFYFCRYLCEPFGVRMFTTLNALCHHLRKALFHQPESSISKKSFLLPMFPMGAFWYLVFRLSGNSVGITKQRKQRIIKYFNSLQLELCCSDVTVSYLRIITKNSLLALRQVLGAGVGLGLAKKRPTKAVPLSNCTIGCILTSIECVPELPYDVFLQPDTPCGCDGIDFIFYEQHRTLLCTIRFSKIVVRDKHVAMDRIPSAIVKSSESGIYVNVWFLYEISLVKVVAINDQSVTCIYVKEPNNGTIEIPIELAEEFIASFGVN
jgi:hypothetical protein